MKTKSINRTYLSIAFLCCLLITTMCRKKDSEATSNSQNQRIIAATVYFNDTLESRGVYTYTGNLLTEVKSYDAGNAEDYKTVFGYTGNTISSCTDYSKSNGSWNKESFMEISGFNGDNPLETISHSYDNTGAEQSQSKTVYTYEGTLLKKMDEYNNNNGSWDLVGSTIYKYDSLGRIQQSNDTMNSWGHITTYTYNAGQMTESLTQSYSYGILANSNKTSYEYANNRLSASKFYYWIAGSWSQEGETQYDYNEFGNELREKYIYTGSSASMRVDVTYGEGSGNFRQCLKIEGDLPFLPGDPTPYPVKSITLKSIRMNFLKYK